MQAIDIPSRLLLVPLSRQLWRNVEQLKVAVPGVGS
jgi:hypothetical protein